MISCPSDIDAHTTQNDPVCSLIEKFEHMKKTGDYYVIVVEDTNLGQIVATATLITEHKFIHSCAKVGFTNKQYTVNPPWIYVNSFLFDVLGLILSGRIVTDTHVTLH